MHILTLVSLQKSVPIPEEPGEVLVSPPQKPRLPPSVPSRPEPNTLSKLSQEQSTAISVSWLPVYGSGRMECGYIIVCRLTQTERRRKRDWR